ncbi:Hint domain-containing protein [Acetobacter persici]|uniref:Hint domain-containing protein n=1 Tax=Acetobacter persici TaxID=1076596 RepID=UPI0039EAE827
MTFTWVGGSSSNWGDGSNWTKDGAVTSSPPGSGDTVDIVSDSNPVISLQPGSKGWVQSGTLNITGTGIVTFDGGASSTNNFGAVNIANGATLKLENGVDLETNTGKSVSGGTVIISTGSTLKCGTSETTILFGDADPTGQTKNTLTVLDNGSGVSKIENLSPGDIVHFPNSSWNNGINFVDTGEKDSDKNEIYKILDGYNDTTPLVSYVTLAKGVSTSDFHWDTGSSSIVCFLANSMIRTPDGDVAVEDLRIGDQIVAFDWKNKKDVLRPVVWVGKARATVRLGLHDDEAGYPVRVLKDAVSDGVPYKDMLITAEHCLFFKGKFVPVRMLVNGASIFYDKSITSYDYYHVETEQHSVITADGMLTESYLDTGNRSSFRQEGRVVALHGTARTWEKDAGAPLCVDRAFVEPLFRMLEWREDSVAGCQTSANAPALTQDPDLHLVTETDAVIRPMRKAAHHYSFMLPPGTQSVRIVSRTSRPADVTGPFVDDRRSMGVAVADIHLFCSKSQHDISAHRQAVKPAGWYPSDGAQCVWTNGNAELPLGDYLTEGKMGILSLQILAAGPYIIRAEGTAETQVKTA